MSRKNLIKIFDHITCLVLITAFLFTSCRRPTSGEEKRIYLHDGWTYGHPDSSERRAAIIPGCFHLDLMRQQLIPDPFYSANEQLKQIQDLENQDWIYETNFDIPDHIYQSRHLEMIFEGLDTYAEVYLNNQQIVTANNMFRTWRSDASGKVLPNDNHLRIIFRSPVQMNRELDENGPYRLPDMRGWTRKAAYQSGWDWGPRLVTSGIWKSVCLVGWDDYQLLGLKYELVELEDSVARCRAVTEVKADAYHLIEWKLYINNRFIKSKKIEVRPGLNLVSIPFTIEDPLLWWPNGMGSQPLYNLKVNASIQGKNQNSVSTRFGLRKVELVHEPDSIGQSFYFRVNGIPVFAKGANYVPQDNFLSRVDKTRYDELIRNAVDANMNMLRVWGGGIYENDVFYDLCDEMGIMVWQDFMFACNMYPVDPAFHENVRLEAIDQVKRLRNHPSIVVWCGNNEVDEGWHNWGWQQQMGYSKNDSTQLWEGYLKLFHEILPDVISSYDNTRSYWPSSPSIGWGHPESLTNGDSHYWGVWWGEEPFEVYEEKVGRFMSEYGFQGFPSLSLLKKYLAPDELTLDSDALRVHQKHPRGMELIKTYMQRDFPVPDNFIDYQYVSQLLQAYGITHAIDAHRYNKPYCMGTLFWQLNDCWPVISWSSIDYGGNWKALHYHVKRAYENIRIVTQQKDDSLYINGVSDSLSDIHISVKMELMDLEGKIKQEEEKETHLQANSRKVIMIFPLQETLSPSELRDHFMLITYSYGKKSGQAFNYFQSPRHLELEAPSIEYTMIDEGTFYLITLKSKYLARYVHLKTSTRGHFSDNFFDIAPNSVKTVRFIPENTGDGQPDLQVKSLYDIL